MRTDAKDLALSVFQRQKDRCVRPPDLAFAVSRRQKGRCIRPPVGELPKEASCEDGPPVTPGMAAQGSAAMNVYNNELTHRKWLHLPILTRFVRSIRPYQVEEP